MKVISSRISQIACIIGRIEMSKESSSAMNRLRALTLFFIVSIVILGVNAKPPARIVGGTDALPGEIIFQVSLRLNGKHYCGGTLVSSRHVLTAAHCTSEFRTDFNHLTVVTGLYNLDIGGEVHKIQAIDVHENFTSGRVGEWHDDIAVITLDGDIAVNTYQSPISLPDENTPGHVIGLVSGWGYKDFEDFPDGSFSSILQKTDMTILTNDECQNAHRAIIDETQICGFKGSYIGTCKGDGGSPLVHKGVVVGIASWFYPCGLGLPDVYTRVFPYLAWILDVISRSFYEIDFS